MRLSSIMIFSLLISKVLASEYSWLENQGYPYKISARELNKDGSICFGKVRDNKTKLIHHVACLIDYGQSCPSPALCKSQTSRDLSHTTPDKKSSVLVENTQVRYSSKESNFFLNLTMNEDSSFNKTFEFGVISEQKKYETSGLNFSEYNFVMKQIEELHQKYITKSDEETSCNDRISLQLKNKFQCLKLKSTSKEFINMKEFWMKFILDKQTSASIFLGKLFN